MSLRELRVRRHKTMCVVADLCGVSRCTIWRWERGFTRPDNCYIELLADVLLVDVRTIIMALGEKK